MRLHLAFTAAVAAAVLWVAAPPAAAQDPPVTLRFAHWVPPVHPLAQAGFEPWARSITEASRNSIRFTFFPAQQLGRAADHYDLARDGVADITFVQPGLSPGRWPIIAAGDQPLMFSHGGSGSAALDAWYRRVRGNEMGDVHFCLAHLHHPGTIHSKRPVRVPSDIRGMNLRPAHAALAAFITSLGANSIAVSPPEVRDALVRGVADALTYPWNSVIVWGIDGVVNHHMDIPLYSSTFVLVMNQRTYDRLTASQRAVVDAHCSTEWAERIGSAWAETDIRGRETLLARPGHTGVQLDAQALAQWQAAAQPMFRIWGDAVRAAGADPDRLLSDLRETIRARGAAQF
jgi:TRAP-type C4-dicarboxylate transport system substrate-binding protein